MITKYYVLSILVVSRGYNYLVLCAIYTSQQDPATISIVILFRVRAFAQ